jgi:hypothetical protein
LKPIEFRVNYTTNTNWKQDVFWTSIYSFSINDSNT